MVGNNACHHDMGKTIKEKYQQDGIETRHADDVLEDTVQEYNRIDITYQQDGSQKELNEVIACQRNESVIQQEQRINHKGKQRMAKHTIGRTPMGHHRIGDGVVARHMKLTVEHASIVDRLL